ncbi:kelch-like protein 41 [Glandiceps talaboti]
MDQFLVENSSSIDASPPEVSPRFDRGEFQNKKHAQLLMEGLHELFESQQFFDVTLVIESRRFACHRNILSACSSYFKAMFTNDLAESRQNQIVICNVNPQAVQLILNYIYSSKLKITEENVQSLLSAAHLFQIQAIVDACCRFMENHLHPTNCIGVYHFADTYTCNGLKNTANSFLNDNFKDVCKQDEFMQLSGEELIEIISREELNVITEEEVFEAAMTWIKYDIENRSQFLYRILCKVRLALIDSNYFQCKIQCNQLIANNDDCQYLVQNVRRLHLSPEKSSQDTDLNATPRSGMWTEEMIVCVGMDCGNEKSRTQVRLYDPRTNRWHAVQPLPNPLGLPACTSTSDHVIYVAGGILYPWEDPTELCYCYDHKQDKWLQRSPLHEPRSYFTLASVKGLVYAIGGLNTLSDNGNVVVSSVECYNPVRNEWQFVSPLPEPVYGHTSVVHNGLIYVIGGVRTGTLITPKVMRYDPQKNVWKEMAPLKNARALCSATVRDDTILVVGGLDRVSRWNTIESPAMCLSSYESYNIKDNVWTEHQHISGAGLFFPVVVSVNGNTYAFQNGLGADGNDIMLVWDDESSTWVYHDSVLPTEDCRFGVTVSRFLKRQKDTASRKKLNISH